jgi:hypothetical protein
MDVELKLDINWKLLLFAKLVTCIVESSVTSMLTLRCCSCCPSNVLVKVRIHVRSLHSVCHLQCAGTQPVLSYYDIDILSGIDDATVASG